MRDHNARTLVPCLGASHPIIFRASLINKLIRIKMSPEQETEYSFQDHLHRSPLATTPKKPKRKSVHFESPALGVMSRLPPASYYASRDPLPWDDRDNSYYNYLDPHDQYLDPSDRDEYDDFAYERSRPHPNLPQPQISLSHTGSLRTSYKNPQSAAPSLYETREVTPQRQYGDSDYDANYERYGGYDHGYSPTRSYQDYQREASPMRSGSPTRIPLTGAAGTAGGYEMAERKLGDVNHVPTAAWLKEEKRSRTKRKWIIIGIILFILAAAAVGVTIWLVKFRNTSSSSKGSSNGRNGAGATAKDLKIDSSLKKIFDGMDYTPLDAQYPGCGCTQANITADVAILSQLTNKIRLYGTDCGQATMVLNAIQDLKVNLTVFLGVWVDNNSTTVQRQLNDMYDILTKYPVGLIDGIAVGNEVLFRKDLTETQLITMIKEVKANVTAMNLGKTLPICTRYGISCLY